MEALIVSWTVEDTGQEAFLIAMNYGSVYGKRLSGRGETMARNLISGGTFLQKQRFNEDCAGRFPALKCSALREDMAKNKKKEEEDDPMERSCSEMPSAGMPRYLDLQDPPGMTSTWISRQAVGEGTIRNRGKTGYSNSEVQGGKKGGGKSSYKGAGKGGKDRSWSSYSNQR